MGMRVINNYDWDSALEDFLIQKSSSLAENTAEMYRSTLSALIDWAKEEGIELHSFQGRNLGRYLEMRRTTPGRYGKPVTDRTRAHYAVNAKVFFKWCKEKEILEVDPLRDYECPRFTRRKMPCPTRDEVKLLLRSIRHRYDPDITPNAKFMKKRRRDFVQTRNLAMVAGLIETAARISEMTNLKLADYHPDELYVVFRDTKTNIDRTNPITEEWVELVNAWLPNRPKKSQCDNLFVSEYGAPIHPGHFGTQFVDIVEWAKLPHYTLHSLRHYAATKLVERADIETARQILGHARLETTLRYTHVSSQHVAFKHKAAGLLTDVLNDVDEPEAPVKRPVILRNKKTEAAKRRKLV